MAGYKLATYQSADGPRAGLVVDDRLFDAAKMTRRPAYATMLGILNDWKTAQGFLKKAAARSRAPNCLRRCSGPRRFFVRVRTTPTMRPR
jgi:hypothetical protein